MRAKNIESTKRSVSIFGMVSVYHIALFYPFSTFFEKAFKHLNTITVHDHIFVVLHLILTYHPLNRRINPSVFSTHFGFRRSMPWFDVYEGDKTSNSCVDEDCKITSNNSYNLVVFTEKENCTSLSKHLR